MKEKFMNHYMRTVIENNNEFSSEELEKMRYGIEGIYLTITKLVVIVILGLILNILKEIIVLLLFYNLLRFFGFGYHAKGSKECLFFSIVFFVLLPYLVVNEIIVFKYKFSIILICSLNFLLFAPSDTKNRPMINKKKKLKRKVAILLLTFIYSLLLFKVNHVFSSLILLSLIIQTVMVNPVIYKLTNEPYNNYKNYLKMN